MSCAVCRVTLEKGDKHFACFAHRKCTRTQPCSFDHLSPPEYWDEVEKAVAAAKCTSPARKSSRTKRLPKVKSTGRPVAKETAPPPLAPLPRKLSGGNRLAPHAPTLSESTGKSSGHSSTGVLTSEAHKGAPLSRSHEISRSGCENGNNPNLNPSEVGQLTTSQSSASDNIRTSDREHSFFSAPQAVHEGSTVPSASLTSAVSSRSSAPASAGSERDSAPFVHPNPPEHPTPPEYPSADPRHLGWGRGPAHTVTSQPAASTQPLYMGAQPYNGLPPQQRQPLMYGGWPQWAMQQMPPWMCNPFMAMQQGYGPASSAGSFSSAGSQQQYPAPVSTHDPAPPIPAATQVHSRPAPTVPASPQTYSDNTVTRWDPPLSITEGGSSSEDNSEEDEAIFDHPDSGDNDLACCLIEHPPSSQGSGGGGDLEIPEGGSRDDLSDREDSSFFRPDRVFPILSQVALLLNLVPPSDVDQHDSLLPYGGLSHHRAPSSALLSLPPDLRLEWDRVSNKRRFASPARNAAKAFSVSTDDFNQFFKTPELDASLVQFLHTEKGKKEPSSFDRFWEQKLVVVDSFLRYLFRLSTFQLLILNAASVSLAANGYSAEEPDSPLAMNKLATEITASSIKHAIAASSMLVRIRRQHAVTGLKGQFVEELCKQMLQLDISGEHLFGNAFPRLVKSVAKRRKSQSALAKSASSKAPPFSRRPRDRKARAPRGTQARYSAPARDNRDSRDYRRPQYSTPAKRRYQESGPSRSASSPYSGNRRSTDARRGGGRGRTRGKRRP